MTPPDQRPRALLLLVVGPHIRVLGTITPDAPIDLGLLDRILRLQLAAQRGGGSLRLREADPALLELLDLAGVRSLVAP